MRLDEPGSEDITAAIDAVADVANADESTLFAISAGRRLFTVNAEYELDDEAMLACYAPAWCFPASRVDPPVRYPR